MEIPGEMISSFIIHFCLLEVMQSIKSANGDYICYITSSLWQPSNSEEFLAFVQFFVREDNYARQDLI